MYRVSNNVRSTHCQDGAVVLDVRQGQMFNLNLVGSKILEHLNSGSSEEQIARVISHEFNADIETVKQDITEFLETLKAYKLVDTPNAGEKPECEEHLADNQQI